MTGAGVLGAVLAVGESRRFGADKARASWRGATLLDWAIGALTPQVDRLVICGRAHGELDWAADRPEPGLGPLGGINAALHRAADLGLGWVLTVPCDAPLPPPDLRAILPAGGSGAFLAEMPVIGLWPASAGAALDERLRMGTDRSMRGWARAIGAAPVSLGREIENVNRREDLERLDAVCVGAERG